MARREFRPPPDFVRRKFLSGQRGNTVMGSWKAVPMDLGEAKRSRSPSAASPAILWFLSHRWKETRPAGRNPCETARCAPSRRALQKNRNQVGRRGQAPALQVSSNDGCSLDYPLIRPSVRTGAPSPQGEGFGETPPHPPRRAEPCKIGRRQNPSQGKPFAFFPKLCYNNSKMPDYTLIWRYPCPTYKY